MKQQLEQVEQFHRVFGHPIESQPVLNKEAALNRLKYLREELDEYEKAIEEGNVVDIADFYADELYFLCGGILLHGLQDKIINVFDTVHNANMTKAEPNQEEADRTVEYYAKQSIPCYVEKREGLFVIKRLDDKKVLKARKWKPPVIKDIIFPEQTSLTE